MTYDEIKKNKEICECLRKGDENLGVLGYTDHSAVHCTMVAKRAAYILKKFGYSEEDIELVKIAGFMHDIGNVVNRKHHAEYGAILANEILKKTDMSMKDRITVVSAIGHHDESTGGATDPVSAALIIALNLQIDTSICSMYEYFDIFLGRMMMCRGAAGILGATFKLTANGSKVL